MRHLVFLAALVAGAGCGGGSNGSDGADLAMAEPRDMAKIRPDLWQPSGCIKGVLQDEAGKPIAMESVLACSAVVCLYGMSGADGSFQICGLHIEPLAIKTEEHCKAPRKGAAMAQALLARDGDTVDVGLLIVPDLGAGVQLAPKMAMPQTLMVGDGLTLTIVSNDFEYPLGGNDCTLAGHLVPPAKHFNFKIPDGGTLLAAYALSPFTATSKSKIGVKADVMAPSMSEVHFWTVAFLDGIVDAKPAIGHADADGKTVSTDPGQGIAQLTWLLISSKP